MEHVFKSILLSLSMFMSWSKVGMEAKDFSKDVPKNLSKLCVNDRLKVMKNKVIFKIISYTFIGFSEYLVLQCIQAVEEYYPTVEWLRMYSEGSYDRMKH